MHKTPRSTSSGLGDRLMMQDFPSGALICRLCSRTEVVRFGTGWVRLASWTTLHHSGSGFPLSRFFRIGSRSPPENMNLNWGALLGEGYQGFCFHYRVMFKAHECPLVQNTTWWGQLGNFRNFDFFGFLSRIFRGSKTWNFKHRLSQG